MGIQGKLRFKWSARKIESETFAIFTFVRFARDGEGIVPFNKLAVAFAVGETDREIIAFLLFS